MNREKRISPRVAFSTVVNIAFTNWSWKALSKDVSICGMFLISNNFPKIGSKINVQFELQGKKVQIPSTVRWVSELGFGIEFGLIGAQITHDINQLSTLKE